MQAKSQERTGTARPPAGLSLSGRAAPAPTHLPVRPRGPQTRPSGQPRTCPRVTRDAQGAGRGRPAEPRDTTGGRTHRASRTSRCVRVRPGGSPRPVPRSAGHPPADPQSVPWMKPKTPPPKQSCAAWDPRPASQGGGAVGGTSATPVTCSVCFLPSPGPWGQGTHLSAQNNGLCVWGEASKDGSAGGRCSKGALQRGGHGVCPFPKPPASPGPPWEGPGSWDPHAPGCSRFVWKPPRGTPRSQAPPPCPVSPFGPGAAVTSIQAQ